MIDAQLVTGATQDMRILTGSALCAALAAKSATAATLANINLGRRMRSSWWRVWRRSADLTPRCRARAVLARVEIGARSVALLRRGLLQHAPLGFDRVEAG